MLLRSLSEHAAGCFYGSEPLAARLWDFLQHPADGDDMQSWHRLQDECYQLLVDSVDGRHPRRYRLNDIHRLMNELCDGDLFLKSGLPWLDARFEQLMMRNGDRLCYRETEVQSYARMAAELDPTLLAAWHLSGWLDDGSRKLAGDIRRIVSAQLPFFAPPGNPVLPFAEGHVHYGGITADSAILDEYLLDDRPPELSKNNSGWHRQQKAQIRSSFRRLKMLLWLLTNGPDAAGDVRRANLWQSEWTCRAGHISAINAIALPEWSLLSKTHSADEVGSAGWLLGEFASAMHDKSAHRWLWLHVYLCRCYRTSSTSPQARVAILCWFQTLNDVRRRLIMDGLGLTRFSKRYYGGPMGRGGERAQPDNIRRLLPENGDLAEFKAMPGTFSPGFVRKLASGIAQHAGHTCPPPPYIFGEDQTPIDARALQYMQTLERWQFCGHFSRSQQKKYREKAHRPDMQALWKIATNLMKNIDQTSAWNLPEFMMGHLHRGFDFHPGRWFRGLDVAGDENDLQIEWFAPLLRWLRRGFLNRPQGELASCGFHLSIHAGEDYAHPVSGMRHIDETVRFCEMRDGDRLGHALALGIEPQWWMARQGEMILPVDEHLDNLVWLWHYAVTLSGRLPLAQQVLPLLERRIARFFPLCNWHYSPGLGTDVEECGPQNARPEAQPEHLFRAWLLRANCYYRLTHLHEVDLLSPLEQIALPDITTLRGSEPAADYYANRHRHIAAGTKQPLVIVRAGDEWQAQNHHVGSLQQDGLLDDVDTPAELEFMHALQDYLLDRYDRIGLIIETNPTSNVYIARLEKHSEHPIFRWNPPDESVLAHGEKYNRFGLRRGPVRVLVNTDDPGIMPTTLRTEFLLLREAAIDSGISRTVAECWLEQLRQYGVEQFHRHHQTVFTPL